MHGTMNIKSKSGFPTIQASSCAKQTSKALKLPCKTFCLPSDHVVHRSASSVLVGALFKKIGLFLNTPRIQYFRQTTVTDKIGADHNISIIAINFQD
jgi:hypothetical protein